MRRFVWYRSIIVQVAAVLMASWLGCVCRYSFSQSSLPAHVRTIAIPELRNDTVEPQLEQEVTEAITSEFVNDTTLRVVTLNEADAAIIGVITDYRNQVFGYDADEQTEEYEVIIVLSVEFKDLVKRKTLWKEENLVGRTTYFVVETSGQVAQDEISGRAQAIERLAQDILTRTVRSWH